MPKRTGPVWSAAKTRWGRRKLYLSLLPAIRKIARKSGYAIGVHGSMTRDLDVIAVPWRSGAVTAETLAYRIHQATSRRACTRPELKMFMRRKPRGRVAYTLIIGPKGAYIDLSIVAGNRK
jgi:hypothetical protein